MNTLFTRTFSAPFQPARPLRVSLGQALSKADRDHYLVAINRAIAEAGEIDAWLKANPNVKLKPAQQEVAADPDVKISPYYSKWVNYQDVRSDQQDFQARMASEDASTWSSITDAEHVLFGWVSVVDQIYSAFKSDPKNLTAGRWIDNIRQPDPPPAPAPVPPAEQPFVILGLELPPKVLGIPTGTALVVGGVGLVGIAIWAVKRS
jgi:hypothetical protein